MSVKDWRPTDLSAIFTSEEEELFREILGRYTEGLDPASQDVRRLGAMLLKVASYSRDEYLFPQRATLVNPIVGNAFLMMFKRREHLCQEMLVPAGVDQIDVFFKALQALVTDAILFVRPFIRLLEKPSDKVLDQFAMAEVSVKVDGEEIGHGAAVSDLLVAQHGSRVPWSFMGLDKESCLFEAYKTPEDIEIGPVGNYVNYKPNVRDRIGLFLPNDTNLIMKLKFSPSELGEDLRIVSGLVAATYKARI